MYKMLNEKDFDVHIDKRGIALNFRDKEVKNLHIVSIKPVFQLVCFNECLVIKK